MKTPYIFLIMLFLLSTSALAVKVETASFSLDVTPDVAASPSGKFHQDAVIWSRDTQTVNCAFQFDKPISGRLLRLETVTETVPVIIQDCHETQTLTSQGVETVTECRPYQSGVQDVSRDVYVDRTSVVEHYNLNGKHQYAIMGWTIPAGKTEYLKWDYETDGMGKWDLYCWKGLFTSPTWELLLDPWFNSSYNVRNQFVAAPTGGGNTKPFYVQFNNGGNFTRASWRADCSDLAITNSTDDEVAFNLSVCNSTSIGVYVNESVASGFTGYIYGNISGSITSKSVPLIAVELYTHTVSYHKLEESSKTYYDLTSNDLDFIAGNDPTRDTGKQGYGQDFDGLNDNTRTQSSEKYEIANVTFSLWLKTDAFDANFRTAMSTFYDPPGSNMYYGCRLDIKPNSHPTLPNYLEFLCGGDAGGEYHVSVISAANTTQYQHLSASWMGNDNIDAYLNGVLTEHSTYGSAGVLQDLLYPVGTKTNLTLGSRWYDGALGQYWNGDIDEVAVFNITFSGVHARHLYNYNVSGPDQRYPFFALPNVSISAGEELYASTKVEKKSPALPVLEGELFTFRSNYTYLSNNSDVGGFAWCMLNSTGIGVVNVSMNYSAGEYSAGPYNYDVDGTYPVSISCYTNVSGIANATLVSHVTVVNVGPGAYLNSIWDWNSGSKSFVSGVVMKYPLYNSVNVSGNCTDNDLTTPVFYLNYTNHTNIYAASVNGSFVLNLSQGNFTTNTSYLDGSLYYTGQLVCVDEDGNVSSVTKSFYAKNTPPVFSFGNGSSVMISSVPSNLSLSCVDDEGETGTVFVSVNNSLNVTGSVDSMLFVASEGYYSFTGTCQDSFWNATNDTMSLTYRVACMLSLDGLTAGFRYRHLNVSGISLSCSNGVGVSNCSYQINEFAPDSISNCSSFSVSLEKGWNRLNFSVNNGGVTSDTEQFSVFGYSMTGDFWDYPLVLYLFALCLLLFFASMMFSSPLGFGIFCLAGLRLAYEFLAMSIIVSVLVAGVVLFFGVLGMIASRKVTDGF